MGLQDALPAGQGKAQEEEDEEKEEEDPSTLTWQCL